MYSFECKDLSAKAALEQFKGAFKDHVTRLKAGSQFHQTGARTVKLFNRYAGEISAFDSVIWFLDHLTIK